MHLRYPRSGSPRRRGQSNKRKQNLRSTGDQFGVLSRQTRHSHSARTGRLQGNPPMPGLSVDVAEATPGRNLPPPQKTPKCNAGAQTLRMRWSSSVMVTLEPASIARSRLPAFRRHCGVSWRNRIRYALSSRLSRIVRCETRCLSSSIVMTVSIAQKARRSSCTPAHPYRANSTGVNGLSAFPLLTCAHLRNLRSNPDPFTAEHTNYAEVSSRTGNCRLGCWSPGN